MNCEGSDEKIYLLNSSKVEDIIEEHQESMKEDPFILLYPGRLIDLHKLWTDNLPTVRPFYSVKCNDDVVILKTLAALGTGFDCASAEELHKVIKLGVPPDDIIFANPAKQRSHILAAATYGIRKMTFDNIAEIKKIKSIFPEADLVVRINYEAKDVSTRLAGKFGADFADAVGLIMEAKRLEMNVIGISFHLGSGVRDIEAYANAIHSASLLFKVAAEIGFKFSLLDIGGGFPGAFEKNDPTMKDLGRVISTAVHEYFHPEMEVEVIAEPGRYYATSLGTLVTSVHSIRQLDGSKYMYYVNDGLHGSFRAVPRGLITLFPESLKDRVTAKRYECMIWGPTCDSFDVLFSGIMLPKLDVGDRLWFRNAGAYGTSMGSTFNGFPLPKNIYVADFVHWVELKTLLPGLTFNDAPFENGGNPFAEDLMEINLEHVVKNVGRIPTTGKLNFDNQSHRFYRRNSKFTRNIIRFFNPVTYFRKDGFQNKNVF